MQKQDTSQRDRAGEALAAILELVESGDLPDAIARTRIARQAGDRPCSAWSIGNQLLCLIAGTEDARGFRQWQEAGRKVKKGARAFSILAPCTVKRTELDAAGDEVERVAVVGFRGVPVFRLEDTEGEELPRVESYAPEVLPPLMDVAERLGVPVIWTASTGGAFGYHWRDLNSGRDGIVLGSHDDGVFFHELAHAAHGRVEALRGGQDARQEVIAETVAAVLCRLYGAGDGTLRTSVDYIAGYAKGERPERAIMRYLADVDRVLDVILSPEAVAA
jgi:hypothetical protein